MRYLLILTTFLFLPLLAHAQEQNSDAATTAGEESSQETPSMFTTPACDFQVDMPDDYFPQIICQGPDKEKCTSKARYTDMDETGGVSIDLLCVPMEAGYYDIYTEDLIAAFSKRVLKEYGVEDPDAQFNFEEEENLKLRNSTAIAHGNFGKLPVLMIVQFWYTPRSILTTEIRIIGENTDETDKKAAAVIQSTRLKEGYKPPSAPIQPFSPEGGL